MAALEFYMPLYPEGDTRNWITVGGSTQNITLIGAVTGDLIKGTINTSLSPITTSKITDFASSVCMCSAQV